MLANLVPPNAARLPRAPRLRSARRCPFPTPPVPCARVWSWSLNPGGRRGQPGSRCRDHLHLPAVVEERAASRAIVSRRPLWPALRPHQRHRGFSPPGRRGEGLTTAERCQRGPVVGRRNSCGSGAAWARRLAALLFSLCRPEGCSADEDTQPAVPRSRPLPAGRTAGRGSPRRPGRRDGAAPGRTSFSLWQPFGRVASLGATEEVSAYVP